MQNQRTPNSILRKRANKENEGRDAGKKTKMRGRRVSFAPDDELETMHLYHKGDRLQTPQRDDDMATSDELAARIPLAQAQQNIPFGAGPSRPSAQGPNTGDLLMLSPMLAPSPMSMELTNNSLDLGGLQPGAQQQAQAGAAQRGGLPGFDFTTNITSAVPALSTLIEEDEEGADDSLDAPPTLNLNRQPQGGSRDQSLELDVSLQGNLMPGPSHGMMGHDMTVSMELAGMTPSGRAGLPDTDPLDDSPVQGFLSPARGTLAGANTPGGAAAANTLSPTSPYALQEMQRHGALGGLGAGLGGNNGAGVSGGAGGSGGQGPHNDDDQDDDDLGSADLKGKWGFTPGVDDTLEMDKGRLVMGETTFNHVYGPSTTGEITRAIGQAAAGGVTASKLFLPNRSVIAATANAALPTAAAAARAAPHAADPADVAMDADDGDRLGGGSDAVSVAPQHAHRTPRASLAGGELTINLLADDNPTLAWNPPNLQPTTAGRTSVASSKPLRSVHGLHDPSHTADDAPGDLGGATLGLLRGDPSFHRPRGAAAAAGLGGTAVTRTVNNFTAQLLAEGTTLSGSSGQLHALLAQRAPAGGSGAAAAWGGAGGDLTSDSALLAAHNRLQGGNNGGVGNRDEMTFASSVGPAGGSARGGAAGGAAGANNRRDMVAASPELHLTGNMGFPGQRSDSNGLEDTLHSLHDFAPPPELQALTAGAGEAAARPDMRAAVAAAAAVPLPGSPMEPAAAEPEQPLPPISLQEFLGLMEIRFLDDMRRRSSLLQPSYGLSLLAPGNTGTPAPLPYGEALESSLITGAHAQLSARLLERLAESVEELQRRAMRTEGAIARNNPPLFKLAQTCDVNALESLRDDMRTLKRLCRQRTLLDWKKTRIAQEQATVTALRDSAAKLDTHLQAFQNALEQGSVLEQRIEEATEQSAHRTRQLQEQIQAYRTAHEQDTMLNLRAAEVAAGNERKAAQLEEAEERARALEEQREAIAQRRAAITEHKERLQAARAAQAAASEADHARCDDPAAPACAAQEMLELTLAVQGLQLDTRDMVFSRASDDLTGNLTGPLTGTPRAAGAARPAGPRWSLTLERQLRLSVTCVGEEQTGAGVEEVCVVEVEAMQSAPEIMRRLLDACFTGEVLPSKRVPRSQTMPYLQLALSQMRSLHALVTELHTALQSCSTLRRIAVDTTAATASLTLVFMHTGALGGFGSGLAWDALDRQPPRKVQVSVPCGPALLQAAAGMDASALALTAHSPLGAAHPAAAAALAARLQRSQRVDWRALCEEVQQCVKDAGVWPVSGAAEQQGMGATHAGTAAGCREGAGLVPQLISNPLFA